MPTYNVDITSFFEDNSQPKKSIYFDSKKNAHHLEFYDPEKSKRCWHDHHPLPEGEEGYSIPVNRSLSIARVCSYECMLAFANSETRPLSRSSPALISELFSKDFPEADLSELKQAGPFESLIEYGGSLTIEEFRKNFHRPRKTNVFMVLSQGMAVPS